jgi:hypothetical protein
MTPGRLPTAQHALSALSPVGATAARDASRFRGVAHDVDKAGAS